MACWWTPIMYITVKACERHGLSTVCSTVCSDTKDNIKACVTDPFVSTDDRRFTHKGPVTQTEFPCNDV